METDDVQQMYDALVAHDFITAMALRFEVSAEAYDDALSLWIASSDASRDYEHRQVAGLAYLAQRARLEDTIGSVLDRLSLDELRELNAIIVPDEGQA